MAGLTTPLSSSGIQSPFQGATTAIPADPITDQTAASIAGLRQLAASFSAPQQDAGDQILFNPTTERISVNGFEFHKDDSRAAVESQGFLGNLNAAVERPAGTRKVSRAEYDTFIKGITDPSIGRVFTEGFGIGIDQAQVLGGAALSFLGAEELGGDIIASNAREIEMASPFQRSLSGVVKGEDSFGSFLAFNAGSLAPLMIETALAALAGAALASTGGGAGAVAGIFTGIGAKLFSLAGRKVLTKQAINLARRQAAGETLTVAEKKLLREISGVTAANLTRGTEVLYGGSRGIGTATQYNMQVNRKMILKAMERGAATLKTEARRARAAGGALVANAANAEILAIGEIYNEVLETGQGDRFSTLLASLPFAGLDILPQVLGAGLVFRGLTRGFRSKALRPNRLSRLKNIGTGALGTGTVEGTTEALQEVISLTATGQMDIHSPEVQERLFDAAGAGFFIGAPLGGLGGAISKPTIDKRVDDGEITNLLESEGTEDVSPPTEPTPTEPTLPVPSDLLEGQVLPPEGPEGPPLIGSRVPIAPTPTPGTPGAQTFDATGNFIPPGNEGAPQGLLNVFGAMTHDELQRFLGRGTITVQIASLSGQPVTEVVSAVDAIGDHQRRVQKLDDLARCIG
jgi:hypothetical protein